VAGEDHFSIVLAPLGAKSGVEVPIVDTGEGMAQVLSVIVLGSLAGTGRLGRDPVLAIEHPELHLHPAVHADLASFFCDLSHSASGPTVVIETHSENFLLRVQRAIAATEISPEHVVVHWVRGLEDGRSVVDTIVFDEAARPQGSGWPPGVFSEDTEQAKEILRLRRERHLT
jgi:predicted ATPase